MPSSYWEETILSDEIMTMDADLDSSLSVFTLALLEDTGWY